MGVAVISLLTDETRKQYLINGIGVLLLFWCLDAVWQSYAGSNLLGYPYDTQLSGVFYPKIRLGLILAILSPFYFEFIRQHAKKYSWLILLLIPYIYVIVLSGNKSSWVMLVISVFLYIIYLSLSGFFSKRLTKTHVIIAFVICFASIILLSNASKIIPENKAIWIEDRMHSMVSLLSGDIDNAGESFQQRIMIWEGAIRVVSDHWINGVGPRGFRYTLSLYLH